MSERGAPYEEPDDNRSVWLSDERAYEPLAPLTGTQSADVAIIGGGFTGVSSAYHLAERFSDRRIVLLEAKSLANGASGRNGGLMLNRVESPHTHEPAQVKAIFDATQEGMSIIESFIREHALDVPCRRSGALKVFTSPGGADRAARELETLRAAGLPLRFLEESELPERLRIVGARGAVLDPTAGRLDGAALVRSLRPVLVELGVGVYENTPVLRIEEGETLVLTTPSGTVRARAVVLATNAYTPTLGYFGESVCAVHSHVIATEPLAANAWGERGWHDVAGFSDDLGRLSYASMTESGRVVFGGGSNAAYAYRYGNRPSFSGAATRSFAAVHRTLLHYLPDAADVSITHRWTGPLALTMSRMCTMGVRGRHDNIYYALGYSGQGITLGNLAGRVIRDLYSDDADRWRRLPFLAHHPSYIPPEPLRFLGYQLYTRLTGRSPRQRVARSG